MIELLTLLAKFVLASGTAIGIFWLVQLRFGNLEDIDPDSKIVKILRGKLGTATAAPTDRHGDEADPAPEIASANQMAWGDPSIPRLPSAYAKYLLEIEKLIDASYSPVEVEANNLPEINPNDPLDIDLKDFARARLEAHRLKRAKFAFDQYPPSERSSSAIEGLGAEKYVH